MSLPRIRALIIEEGKILLFRRIRPDRPAPYYVTPGGGMEEYDRSEHEAILRELKEELGVESGDVGRKVFELIDDKGRTHIIYECRIGKGQFEKRTGKEFEDPQKGTYEIMWIPQDQVAQLDIRPAKLKDFLVQKYGASTPH